MQALPGFEAARRATTSLPFAIRCSPCTAVRPAVASSSGRPPSPSCAHLLVNRPPCRPLSSLPAQPCHRVHHDRHCPARHACPSSPYNTPP
ncbi:hypothetical protein NL676_008556 [Syzygium grande]|nr:hypothetical protein NL676_008556 [Syzygium grande]